MNSYLFWGIVSSIFFLSAVPAIGHQLWLIYSRKQQRRRGELKAEATQSISLNQIFSSYCGVYSFFLFGVVLDPPDLFLTVPRCISALLLYAVVIEIHRERRDRASQWAFWGCTASALIPIFLVLAGIRTSIGSRVLSESFVLVATILMAQGCLAQHRILKSNCHRGAVSLPMHAMLYAKDFSGLMFGFELGAGSWSIIIMHASNLLMRLPILYTYLRLK